MRIDGSMSVMEGVMLIAAVGLDGEGRKPLLGLVEGSAEKAQWCRVCSMS